RHHFGHQIHERTIWQIFSESNRPESYATNVHLNHLKILGLVYATAGESSSIPDEFRQEFVRLVSRDGEPAAFVISPEHVTNDGPLSFNYGAWMKTAFGEDVARSYTAKNRRAQVNTAVRALREDPFSWRWAMLWQANDYITKTTLKRLQAIARAI